MKREIKACVFCEHCQYYEPSWHSSDSGLARYVCDEGRFSDQPINVMEALWPLRAMTCPDYVLNHEIIENLQK